MLWEETKIAKFGIDLDGCLADFNRGYGQLLEKYGGKKLPDGWWSLLTKGEFPTLWDWDKAAGYTSEERGKAWDEIKSTDFWFELDALPDAQEALELLDRLGVDHEIYFLTHRQGKQCKQQTEDWLFGHGLVNTTATVLVTGDDKTPMIASLGLDFYCDDKPIHILRAADLQNTSAYLIDQPWNREYMGPLRDRVTSVRHALLNYCTEERIYIG